MEEQITRVTNWILDIGEKMLNSEQCVGFDVTSSEELRYNHEKLELGCRETYGQYAELLHKYDTLRKNGVAAAVSGDLKAQTEFMSFVCRSFATRLEKRRNILITSSRFFRFVTKYFQITSEAYEKLVMNVDLETLQSPEEVLTQLKESQEKVEKIEKELSREGEKLSDLLSIPIKTALGVVLQVDYKDDIANIRDILDMTTSRRRLFRDRVELQRLSLQQLSHIRVYERHGLQATNWLNKLYEVMLKSHSHVGCSVREINFQKDDHLAFHKTAKNTFDFGCQLLNAALTLRGSCKLSPISNADLTKDLHSSWRELSTLNQEQLARLRVSSMFHRNMDQFGEQLREMTKYIDIIEKEADPIRRQALLGAVLKDREKILLEIGRTMRLGRLLKTRLRQPLTPDRKARVNDCAEEAITRKFYEITKLAERLDKAIYHDPSRTIKKKMVRHSTPIRQRIIPSQDSQSEDEYHTASSDSAAESHLVIDNLVSAGDKSTGESSSSVDSTCDHYETASNSPNIITTNRKDDEIESRAHDDVHVWEEDNTIPRNTESDSIDRVDSVKTSDNTIPLNSTNLRLIEEESNDTKVIDEFLLGSDSSSDSNYINSEKLDESKESVIYSVIFHKGNDSDVNEFNDRISAESDDKRISNDITYDEIKNVTIINCVKEENNSNSSDVNGNICDSAINITPEYDEFNAPFFINNSKGCRRSLALYAAKTAPNFSFHFPENHQISPVHYATIDFSSTRSSALNASQDENNNDINANNNNNVDNDINETLSCDNRDLSTKKFTINSDYSENKASKENINETIESDGNRSDDSFDVKFNKNCVKIKMRDDNSEGKTTTEKNVLYNKDCILKQALTGIF